MKKLFFISLFLTASILIFSGCPSTITETATVTETSPPKTTTVTVTETPPPQTTTATVTVTATTTVAATTTTTPGTTTTTPPVITGDLSDAVLLGFRDGMNIYDENGIFVPYKEFDWIQDIAVDHQGNIWVVDLIDLYCYDGQDWKNYEYPAGVYSTDMVAVDSSDRLWFGYYGGVSVYDGGQWTSYDSDLFGLGQFSDLINDIVVDNQDRVWVATSDGVAVYDGGSWTSYDENSGLYDEHAEAIVADPQGRIWIGHTYGVEVFDGTTWTLFGDWAEAPNIAVDDLFQAKSLAVDDQGNIWVGTYADGIFVYNGIYWTNYNRIDCLLGSPVRVITADSQGNIWVGTDLGLTVFDGSNWHHYTKNSSGLFGNRVYAIAVTGTGPLSLPQAPPLGTGSVSGRVTENGLPVSGLTVSLCCDPYLVKYDLPLGSVAVYTVTTDANGQFTFTGIPTSRYGIAIHLPDGSWEVPITDVIVDGDTQTLEDLEV